MMLSSCRYANFVALLRYDNSIQETVPELVKVFERVMAEDTRGTRLAYLESASHPSEAIAVIGSRSSKALNPTLYSAYLATLSSRDIAIVPPPSKYVDFVRKMAIRGVSYAKRDEVERDSDVLFRRGTTQNGTPILCPGQIIEMFMAAGDEPDVVTPFVAVRPYLPLPRSADNEFIRLDAVCQSFMPVGGFLSSTDSENVVCVLYATDIVCHFAKLTYEDQRIMHVLQLGRVHSFSRSPLSSQLNWIHSYGRNWRMRTRMRKSRITQHSGRKIYCCAGGPTTAPERSSKGVVHSRSHIYSVIFTSLWILQLFIN